LWLLLVRIFVERNIQQFFQGFIFVFGGIQALVGYFLKQIISDGTCNKM
jgi:hypothetical protein